MYAAGVRYVIQSESLAGRAVRRQMHQQVRDKETGMFVKDTFMQNYITLHKMDMEEEDNDPHRRQLRPYM